MTKTSRQERRIITYRNGPEESELADEGWARGYWGAPERPGCFPPFVVEEGYDREGHSLEGELHLLPGWILSDQLWPQVPTTFTEMAPVQAPTKDPALVEVSGAIPWNLVPINVDAIVSVRNRTYTGSIVYVDAHGIDIVSTAPDSSVSIPWANVRHIGFLG